jgi:hypothetical protein
MLIQGVSWPGVAGVESCEGSIQHGCGPSTFVLTTVPQVAQPQVFGDLVWTDGTNVVRLRGCKMHNLGGRLDSRGQTYVLEILDRRWRWQGFGAVRGRFNRTDAHGKLIPWAIRSPKEMAAICLAEMGETNYLIDLPEGLSQKDGRDLDRYLRLGENFPQTLANAPQTWDYSPPAEVLGRLADYFGRRVIYQPVLDRILIAPLGYGGGLPDGGSELIAPTVKVPEAPAGIGIAGTVRIQARFALEAVGREWDDSFLPINDLSYAPRFKAAVQITALTFLGGTASSLTVTFTWNDGGAKSASVTCSGATNADVWASLRAGIYANPTLAAFILPSFSGSTFQFTGTKPMPFTVSFTQASGATGYKLNVGQVGRVGGGDWSTCPPPSFSSVLATERLSRLEAQMKAKATVFRCYRIKNVDPATGKGPLRLPWFGKILRRQQVTLLPDRVAQVVPQARVEGGTNKGALYPPGQLSGGILPEYYNGYSRDQAAVVYGAVSRFVGAVNWVPAAIGGGSPFNTSPHDRVYVDFVVDPVEQIITFSDYVFLNDFSGGGWVAAPSLILETGCLVSDAETDQVVRWTWEKALGGPAPKLWAVREDAEVGVIGTYDEDHKLTGYDTLNKADADARAGYYIDALQIPFQLSAGVVRQYPGLLPIDPNGMIQQVSWSVGPDGPTTIASANCEHSPNVPDYPNRRLKENLRGNAAAAAANLVEREQSQKMFPRPGGAVQ